MGLFVCLLICLALNYSHNLQPFYILELMSRTYFSENKHSSEKFGCMPLTDKNTETLGTPITVHCDGNANSIVAF